MKSYLVSYSWQSEEKKGGGFGACVLHNIDGIEEDGGLKKFSDILSEICFKDGMGKAKCVPIAITML